MATENNEVKVPRRILNTLITSLSAGVVPRIGAPYIAIGREEELGSLLDNLDDVADGGAACRFLIGRYGSGKSYWGKRVVQMSLTLKPTLLTANTNW